MGVQIMGCNKGVRKLECSIDLYLIADLLTSRSPHVSDNHFHPVSVSFFWGHHTIST